jgi:hypothetical protein
MIKMSEEQAKVAQDATERFRPQWNSFTWAIVDKVVRLCEA